ncbi:uncharacterized protein F5891DRAFT_957168 [Suillus fuscotomentosus]|uniref:Integrase core domain-containing protein n=1 Tax=Suillus fuscotomentosus TaxID=1912939 RepID=A0AAD4HJ73_9AGAM|nr:uncharacterized protein F5891DRAFT_957168 [Suillus fuscotomentosus]KAG1897464.1 hypothetical protein F5891DRAFT_957168 [Suillus fuscotomentosus]
MENRRGVERGSYIWGRSVHNICIERLWRDVTQGFGRKWKLFFQLLEVHHDLKPNLDAHIWLLHHVFLDALNEDAIQWAEAWNHHQLRIPGGGQQSPRDLFFFGMIQNGARGYDPTSLPGDSEIGDIQEYGIDWEDYNDNNIQNHHDNVNTTDSDDQAQNPFFTHQPQHLSDIRVPETYSPLTHQQVEHLDDYLAGHPDSRSQSMDRRRSLWVDALNFCVEMFNVSYPQ